MSGFNSRTRGLISILIVMFIWGSAFTVTKVAVEEAPPLLIAFLRNLVACIILVPFYLAGNKRMKQQAVRLPRGKIFLMGLTGITLFYSLFNMALVHTDASIGALIQGFIPVAVALGAVFFLNEKLTKNHLSGIVLCVTGVILVGFVGKQENTGNALLGNVLMILSVFAWAAYTLLAKKLSEYDPVVVVSLVTFIGTILFIPAVVIELSDQPTPSLSWRTWAAIVYLGAFASALSYILYNKALKTLSATQIGSFLNLDPVIGAVIAFIFLKDKMTILQVAGGLLVLAGVWLSSSTRKKKG